MADRSPVNLRWAVVIAWAVCVVTVSVLPGRALHGPDIIGLDKVAHFVFYAVLAILAQHAVRKPCLARWAAVTVSCGLFGAMLELAQGLVPERSMSVGDALANFLGAAAGSAGYMLWARRRATT